jgi:long-chain acyl-CoA synthetase
MFGKRQKPMGQPATETYSLAQLMKIRRDENSSEKNAVVLRKKRFGVWQEITWDELYENTRWFSLGLSSLGLGPGEKVCIINNNEPEWLVATLATEIAGGVSVAGGHADSGLEELAFIIDHSDSIFVIVEGQEQVDKLLHIRDRIPGVKRIVYWNDKGLKNHDDPLAMSYESVIGSGRQFEKVHSGLFERNIENCGKAGQATSLIYAPDATGKLRGVLWIDSACYELFEDYFALFPNSKDDNLMSTMPLAWPIDKATLFYRAFRFGGIVNFPEGPETVDEDVREIGPGFLLVTPDQMEAKIRSMQAGIRGSKGIKKGIYELLMPIGYRIADMKAANKNPGLLWRVAYSIGYVLMFRPIRDMLGLLKVRSVNCVGASLDAEITRFLCALGIDFRMGYALPETGMVVIARKRDDQGFDGVGTPCNCKISYRIDDGGEILIKSSYHMAGYYKEPEASAMTWDADGYLHTGHRGFINQSGQLVVRDRKTP